jgi:hypothetical protein
MSKIIKPLLNADGTQVKRKLVKGDWYYSFALDNFSQWYQDGSAFEYLVYCEDKWKPKENEMYYYCSFHHCGVVSTYYSNDYLFHRTNIVIGNCFRTRKAAEQADIQVILENLKQYYKNKEGK